MLPARMLAAYRDARKVVEVGAGTQWAHALALAQALPGCEVVVMDTDPRVLEAPKALRAVLADAFRPQRALYEGASLLYAVRAPEELQAALAGIARSVGADVAFLPLGQELTRPEGWRHEVVEGWHWLRAPS
ncbi:MAG: hypothetical protein LC624_03870 [Halobacteriales archaeon]|nr:hypothetical protein [Halobacteriales archaeon]